MKVNVKFANGNGMAFLGQGYITYDDKKVFVRYGYSFTWPKAKDLGLVQQSEFRNGTMLKFNRVILFYKTECFYQYQLMTQLEIAFKVMDFKLL